MEGLEIATTDRQNQHNEDDHEASATDPRQEVPTLSHGASRRHHSQQSLLPGNPVATETTGSETPPWTKDSIPRWGPAPPRLFSTTRHPDGMNDG